MFSLTDSLDSGIRRNDGGQLPLCALHLNDYGVVMTIRQNLSYETMAASAFRSIFVLSPTMALRM